jgi:hypothetical protein
MGFHSAVDLRLDGGRFAWLAVQRRFLALQHEAFADAIHGIVVHAQSFPDFATGETPVVAMAIAP